MALEHVSGQSKLVQRKRGPVWYLIYRVPDPGRPEGKQVKKKLGPAWLGKGRPPAGYFTERMADEALSEIRVDFARGDLPGASGATFKQACDEFLRYSRKVRQVDEKTAADYEGVIAGYLLDEFGTDTPAEQISPDDIDAYKEKLLAGEIPEGKRKLSNRTIVRHLTVLHGIFKRAKRKWGLHENPASADLVERPSVVYSGEFDTFDRDEIELLAATAENPQDAAIFRTAAYTGLRQGELLALRWKCVDFLSGLVHVRKNFTGGREKIPKGKRVRSVPMMADVVTALARLKEERGGRFTGDDDLVFVNEVGEYVDHFELRRRYYDALEKAGLRRVKFHDLRHAFGTAAIKKLDPLAVQGYMGHQHYSTTQRYLHHQPRPEDAAKLADAFGVTNGVTNGRIPSATERNSEQPVVPEKPSTKAT